MCIFRCIEGLSIVLHGDNGSEVKDSLRFVTGARDNNAVFKLAGFVRRRVDEPLAVGAGCFRQLRGESS